MHGIQRDMKHIKKIATYAAVGGFGAIIMAGLAGCGSDDGGNENALNEVAQKNGAFVIIEESAPGVYKILEEYPSTETRIVLKDINGTERVLGYDEIENLLTHASDTEDSNTLNSTKASDAQLSSGGLSLGETILSSAAGAILGSWIGSKLISSLTYQAIRQASSYAHQSVYSRSSESYNKSKRRYRTSSDSSTKSSGRSGFFSGGKKSHLHFGG